MNIHPTAFVDPLASIAPDVEIGPFSFIDAGATIESGCKIAGQVQILRHVRLGPNCEVGGGTILGGDPQDLGFDAATPSRVEIGPNNRFREHVTVHRGSKEGSATTIGDGNYLMAGSHLGHDVHIGNNNVLANNVLLGGHVQMGNRNFLGGGSAYHQFIRIGDFCMVKGNSSISQDVPPFVLCALVNEVHGLNVVGIRRAGFDSESRRSLKRAYDVFFRGGYNKPQALEELKKREWEGPALQFIEFIEQDSEKGICRPPKTVPKR